MPIFAIRVFGPIQRIMERCISGGSKVLWMMKPESSCYPEFPRKSAARIMIDIAAWFLRYKEFCGFYNLYGFDIAEPERDMSLFQNYRSFMDDRSKGNKLGRPDSQVVLLRDKFLFYKYMESNHVPVPEVFAVMRDGVLFDVNMNPIDDSALQDRENYFVKDVCGECASFVKHVNDYDDFMRLRPELNGSYIFQTAVIQNTVMNSINSKSINTLRIVTINKNDKPYLLTALLRVGTEKTGNVDNWAAGGLAVGIQSDGTLKERGFYKPVHGTSSQVHPDSGIAFSDFKVPYYEEAVRLACRAHQLFYNVRSIGWDVAIQEDGPIFIEGNDNWEISLQQACDRPLRNEWKEAMET